MYLTRAEAITILGTKAFRMHRRDGSLSPTRLRGQMFFADDVHRLARQAVRKNAAGVKSANESGAFWLPLRGDAFEGLPIIVQDFH